MQISFGLDYSVMDLLFTKRPGSQIDISNEENYSAITLKT
jgi:hypothetical protein